MKEITPSSPHLKVGASGDAFSVIHQCGGVGHEVYSRIEPVCLIYTVPRRLSQTICPGSTGIFVYTDTHTTIYTLARHSHCCSDRHQRESPANGDASRNFAGCSKKQCE
jgi:hypothetical protein